MKVLNKKRASFAKLLLEERGSITGARTPVPKPLSAASIKEAALTRYNHFFGYAKNIFLGDSRENSSIQEHLDAGHPEMAEPEAVRARGPDQARLGARRLIPGDRAEGHMNPTRLTDNLDVLESVVADRLGECLDRIARPAPTLDSYRFDLGTSRRSTAGARCRRRSMCSCRWRSCHTCGPTSSGGLSAASCPRAATCPSSAGSGPSTTVGCCRPGRRRSSCSPVTTSAAGSRCSACCRASTGSPGATCSGSTRFARASR